MYNISSATTDHVEGENTLWGLEQEKTTQTSYRRGSN